MNERECGGRSKKMSDEETESGQESPNSGIVNVSVVAGYSTTHQTQDSILNEIKSDLAMLFDIPVSSASSA